jgi:hypothetical protein
VLADNRLFGVMHHGTAFLQLPTPGIQRSSVENIMVGHQFTVTPPKCFLTRVSTRTLADAFPVGLDT